MSLGARLKKLRLKSGQSLQQLADAVGVSKAHIYELEIDKVKNPSIEVLRKLAKVFAVPVTYFIDDDDDVEFQVMFRDLQKDLEALSPVDREIIELMVQALKNRKNKDNEN